jgi:hypothetical protein
VAVYDITTDCGRSFTFVTGAKNAAAHQPSVYQVHSGIYTQATRMTEWPQEAAVMRIPDTQQEVFEKINSDFIKKTFVLPATGRMHVMTDQLKTHSVLRFYNFPGYVE